MSAVKTKISFAGPDPDSFVSGGNIYNGHLLESLRKLGAAIEIIPPGAENSPDAQICIIDSIYFDKKFSPESLHGLKLGLIHHLTSLEQGRGAYFNRIETPILDACDGFIATSRFTRDHLMRKGYDKNGIIVLEPVPPKDIIRLPKQTGKLRGLMLNSLIPRKGVLEFLEEMAKCSIQPVYSITIAGSLDLDRAYSRACQDVVRNDHNLKRCIRFTGAQERGVIRKFFDTHNVFISAATMETYGMAIQEAKLAGLALLIRAGGNAANHVEPEEIGIVCADAQAMAKSIERLALNHAERSRLIHAANAYKPQYSATWDGHAHKLLDLL